MVLRSSVLLGGLVFSMSFSAHTDSIRVDGKAFRNVLVSESDALFYIRIPKTGDFFSVLKSKATVSDVTLSARTERRKLQTEWRSNSKAKKRAGITAPPDPNAPRIILPSTGESLKGAEVNAPDNGTGLLSVTKRSGDVHITNRPEDFARRQRDRKVFMSKNGTGLLTNRPAKFAQDEDYVEVEISYEVIEVPKRFTQTAVRRSLPSSHFDEIVQYYARHHGLDPMLVYAVIRQESNFDPGVISSAGAAGLMQLMPGTAQEMGVRNIFDPAENVAGGTQYLSKMLKLHKNDVDLALASYNAGPGNVRKYRGVPPFKETLNYIRSVKKFKAQYAKNGAPRVQVAAAPLAIAQRAYKRPPKKEFIQLVLYNGMVTSADNITETETFYHYEFKHKSGVIQKKFVREIIHPGTAAD